MSLILFCFTFGYVLTLLGLGGHYFAMILMLICAIVAVNVD